jgi:hypothetical protein
LGERLYRDVTLRLSYPCTIVHPSFIKLVRFITCLVQALHNLRRQQVLSSPASLHIHIPPHTPTPICISVPEYSRLPSPFEIRTPSPSPFGLRSPPDSPLSSTTTLEGYEPSEGSTVAWNNFEEPPLQRPDSFNGGHFEIPQTDDLDFIDEEGELQITETQETFLEYQVIKSIRSRIVSNRLSYLQLVQTFGEFGVVPGTGDWVVRDFFPAYLQAAAASTSPIHVPASLYSE